MKASYEPHQLSQILSLLHDQRSPVTLRTVMLELSVNRPTARYILQAVAEKCRHSSFHIVRMKTSNYTHIYPSSVGCSDVRRRSVILQDTSGTLQYDVQHADEGKSSNEAILAIVPLAPTDFSNDKEENTNETIVNFVTAAHERALADQREKLLSDETTEELLELFDCSKGGITSTVSGGDDCLISSSLIVPAPELCLETTSEGVNIIRRRKRGRCDTVDNGQRNIRTSGKAATISSSLRVKSTLPAPIKGDKCTTALEFFSNASSVGKGKKLEISNETISTSKTSGKENKPQVLDDIDITNNDNRDKLPGNVDDFKGDTDEDEEFILEEKARKARIAKNARMEIRELMNDESLKKRIRAPMASRRSNVAPEKRQKAEKKEDHMEDSNEEIEFSKKEEYEAEMVGVSEKVEETKKSGAMDSFAKKVSSVDANGSKRRRKKMVEQTVEDENGYLRTETVAVWEEILDDNNEEKMSSEPLQENPVKTSAVEISGKNKKSGASELNKGKKQAGLMGFFKKK